jgi:hypothetical protein
LIKTTGLSANSMGDTQHVQDRQTTVKLTGMVVLGSLGTARLLTQDFAIGLTHQEQEQQH